MLNLYATLRRFAWTALLSGGGLLSAQAQTLGQTVAGATNVAGTYTDLSTTGTAIATANTDNANSTAQDIGFSFSYRGTLYTQFVLNTNGLIRLGNAAPSSAAMYIDPNTPIVGVDPVGSPNAADVNLIMPFNLDLIAGTGTGGTEYRVATTGATGSRVCTIQWKNVADKAGTSSGNAQQYSNISFQAKLYEAGGTIEFVYGTATASAAAANLRSVNVGLKGATAGANQLLLATKASSDAWSTTTFRNTAYGLNTHDVDKTALPTAGRTYRLTDPAYCAAGPISTYPYTQNFDAVTAPALPCGVTTLNVNNDSGVWAVYNSATDAASAPNSMRYNYSSANVANDWFFTAPMQMRAGYSYQLQFKYRASFVSGTGEALEVKAGAAATVAGQTTTLFTNNSITNTAYATTATGNVAGQVDIFTPTTSGVYYFSFHAISPANRWNLHVDDLVVNEIPTPACPQPTALAVSAITITGATVTFTAPAGGTAYSVIYGPVGFNPTTPGAGTATPVGPATSVTLTGLNGNTRYDVYVQATCGTAGTGLFTGPVTFLTACPPTITAFPYLESFDGVTAPALPCGVTILNVNNDSGIWATNTGTANSAPNAMRYNYNATNAADDWFFTSALQMRAGYSYQLQFKYRGYSPTLTEAMEVKVGSAATAAGQTTTVYTNNNVDNVTYITTAAGPLAGQVALFTPTTSGVYYFGFHATSVRNAWYIYIDDMRVDEIPTPTCPQPTAVALSAITTTSATVTVTAPAGGSGYSVIYGPVGFNPATPGAGTTTPVSISPSITISGLTGNTSYDIYVQTTCGTTSTSLLTGPVTLLTACPTVTTFPYLENFDGVLAPVLPCGITVLDANNDGKRWENYSSTTYSASAPNSMRYNYSGSVAADDWFFTNALQMQAGNTYQLQFKYRSYLSGYTQGLEVKVGTGANAAGQTTTVFTNNSITNLTHTTTTAGTGAGQVVSFTPTTSGVYYFGFHAISLANQYYLYVDDVRVDLTSLGACPTPTNIAVSGITANTATVSFNATPGTSYRAIYGARGFNPASAGTTTPAVTGGTITLSPLTPITNYDVYIQAVCGTNVNSLLAGPVAFTTACATTLVFPYTERFDGVTAPALPCGITVLDVNNDGSTWVNSNFNPSSGTNSMRYNPSATNAADDWFFTNALDLKVNTRYQLEFKYRVFSYNYPERMEVKIGTSTTVASQTTTLFSNMAIINNAYTTTSPGAATGQVLSFTPTTAGTYFIGFHAMSIANSFDIYVDDIAVTATAVTSTKSNAAPGFRAEASPVPFSDHLTLTLNTLAAGPLQLTLHDGVGRVVRETTAAVPAGASSLAVPEVSTLPAGIYILTVRQGGNTQVIRVAHE